MTCDSSPVLAVLCCGSCGCGVVLGCCHGLELDLELGLELELGPGLGLELELGWFGLVRAALS